MLLVETCTCEHVHTNVGVHVGVLGSILMLGCVCVCVCVCVGVCVSPIGRMVVGSLSSVSTWSPRQMLTENDNDSSDIFIPLAPSDVYTQPGQRSNVLS